MAMIEVVAAVIDGNRLSTNLPEIDAIRQQVGAENVTSLVDEAVVDINYPVLRYPEKIKSLNLDKTPTIEGRLEGIKGQYLLFDTGVINIRKYAGYQVSVEG